MFDFISAHQVSSKTQLFLITVLALYPGPNPTELDHWASNIIIQYHDSFQYMSKFGYFSKTGIFLIYYRRSLLAVWTEIAVTVPRRSLSTPFDLLHQIQVCKIEILHRTKQHQHNIQTCLLLPICTAVNHHPLIYVLAEWITSVWTTCNVCYYSVRDLDCKF